MTLDIILAELEACSTPQKKDFLPYFFKAGEGQYGEGDKFLGVVVPDTRKIAKKYYPEISFTVIDEMLNNEYHECRLCALLILIEKYKKATAENKEKIFYYYLSKTERINNWDLVDLSVKDIVGDYLLDKDRIALYHLASSDLLWDQRIAVVATYAFIRNDDFTDILALAEMLLEHKHDLMHKAIGWMLREVGKRDKAVLSAFLDDYHKVMPRTMLRYSIEKFTPEERKHYMRK